MVTKGDIVWSKYWKISSVGQLKVETMCLPIVGIVKLVLRRRGIEAQ